MRTRAPGWLTPLPSGSGALAHQRADCPERHREGREIELLEGCDLIEGGSGSSEALSLVPLPCQHPPKRVGQTRRRLDHGASEVDEGRVEIRAKGGAGQRTPAVLP